MPMLTDDATFLLSQIDIMREMKTRNLSRLDLEIEEYRDAKSTRAVPLPTLERETLEDGAKPKGAPHQARVSGRSTALPGSSCGTSAARAAPGLASYSGLS
jgi:hypothetical protein